jgi:hypothetical protein
MRIIQESIHRAELKYHKNFTPIATIQNLVGEGVRAQGTFRMHTT